MALISFLAGESYAISNLAGSGLGFYGDSGFGASVQVGAYQGRTFITDAAGTIQGPECDNVKWTHANSGILGQAGSSVNLTHIPNYQSTLNIRFTHTSAVKTQNVKLRIYDRTNINVGATGVLTQVAEIIHPNEVQGAGGSGDTTWLQPAGSSVVVDLVASPGTSGYSPNGVNTSDTQHDWFVAMSASPTTIGSKTQYGLYCQLEYL
jgi:hypothetical protein